MSTDPRRLTFVRPLHVAHYIQTDPSSIRRQHLSKYLMLFTILRFQIGTNTAVTAPDLIDMSTFITTHILIVCRLKQELAQDIALMRYSMISPLIVGLPDEYRSKEAYFRAASAPHWHEHVHNDAYPDCLSSFLLKQDCLRNGLRCLHPSGANIYQTLVPALPKEWFWWAAPFRPQRWRYFPKKSSLSFFLRKLSFL